MSNKRMSLSEEGKGILDMVANTLETERPVAIKVALSRGLAISNGPVNDEYILGKNKWTIPDNIIKEKEFLLFKHLIINEVNTSLDDHELHKHMELFIEKGLRQLKADMENKSSLEDFRLIIL
ncbi:hypothetical protein ACQCT6_18075 [Cytobacillus gottheilii]|uniref:hypothetical protein n=1 Tax=Cytobacillus gottheilii TaxID=859144 RepID=UPI003CF11C86